MNLQQIATATSNLTMLLPVSLRPVSFSLVGRCQRRHLRRKKTERAGGRANRRR